MVLAISMVWWFFALAGIEAYAENWDDMDEIYVYDNERGAYTLTVQMSIPGFMLLDNGVEVPVENVPPLGLRIANGGGGQAGIVGEYARQFLTKHKMESISIGWRGTNTHFSIKSLEMDRADVAILYDIEREQEMMNKGHVYPRLVHSWMDNFNVIGPKDNKAQIQPTDTIEDAIRKVMKTPDCYWLVRDDGSTISERGRDKLYAVLSDIRRSLRLVYREKETLLSQFMAQGNIHMAFHDWVRTKSLWAKEGYEKELEQFATDFGYMAHQDRSHAAYRPYVKMVRPEFMHRYYLLPAQATQMANEFGYYTISDNGVLNSLDPVKTRKLAVFMNGATNGQSAFFYNPADALIGKKTQHLKLAESFLDFLESPQGEDIAGSYSGRSEKNDRPLYKRPFETYKKDVKESWDVFFMRRKCLLTMNVRQCSHFSISENIANAAA